MRRRAGRDRPRRHPGRRPARLHVSVGRVPVPADRRSGAHARAHAPDAGAGEHRRAVAGAARRRPRCTPRSPTTASTPSSCRTTLLATFPDEFREGMAARAERLGDRGPSAPANWEAGPRHRRGARAGDALRRRRGAARAGARGAARRRRRGRDQDRPRAARRGARPGSRTTSASPTGSRSRRSRAAAWRRGRATASPTAAAAGGRSGPASSCTATRTRTGCCPPRPARPSTATAPSPSTASSSMDVAAFRRFVGATTDFPGGPELLAAKLVGRRPRRHAARATPAAINDFSYARRPRRPALPARRPHPPRQPARLAGLLRRPALQPPPPHPPRPLLRPAAPAGRHRGRRRRPRPDLRLLQRQHLAPVRDRPGALDRRRRPVRPRPRQGLPHRRAARHRRAR